MKDISGKALLAGMGMSNGKLSPTMERLYWDLAFFSRVCCGNYLASKSQALSDMFWELEGFADPRQTSGKLDWGWRLAEQFLNTDLEDLTPEMIETVTGVQDRLQPLLIKLGLWG